MMKDMDHERLSSLELAVSAIEERNRRVQDDKAWETSIFRRVILSLMTYVIATLIFWSIGSARPFLDACIPTIGYILSTQSLPFIKKMWLRRRK